MINQWVYYNDTKECIEILEHIKNTIILKDKTIIDDKWYIKESDNPNPRSNTKKKEEDEMEVDEKVERKERIKYKCQVKLNDGIPDTIEYMDSSFDFVQTKMIFKKIKYSIKEYIKKSEKNRERTIEFMNKIKSNVVYANELYWNNSRDYGFMISNLLIIEVSALNYEITFDYDGKKEKVPESWIWKMFDKNSELLVKQIRMNEKNDEKREKIVRKRHIKTERETWKKYTAVQLNDKEKIEYEMGLLNITSTDPTLKVGRKKNTSQKLFLEKTNKQLWCEQSCREWPIDI